MFFWNSGSVDALRGHLVTGVLLDQCLELVLGMVVNVIAVALALAAPPAVDVGTGRG